MPTNIEHSTNALDDLVAQAACLEIGNASLSREELTRQLFKLRALFQKAYELGSVDAFASTAGVADVPVPLSGGMGIRLEDAGFSNRTINSLNNCCIYTLGELTARCRKDFLRAPNIGPKALREITEITHQYGLRLSNSTSEPLHHEKIKAAVFGAPETVLRVITSDNPREYLDDSEANAFVTSLSLEFALWWSRAFSTAEYYAKQRLGQV